MCLTRVIVAGLTVRMPEEPGTPLREKPVLEGEEGTPKGASDRASSQRTLSLSQGEDADPRLVQTQSAAAEEMKASEPDVEDRLLPLEDVNTNAVAQYSEGTQRLHILSLRWDTKRQWGQIRPLNKEDVCQLRRRLLEAPPRHPIQILVRSMNEGLFHFPRIEENFLIHRIVCCHWRSTLGCSNQRLLQVLR